MKMTPTTPLSRNGRCAEKRGLFVSKPALGLKARCACKSSAEEQMNTLTTPSSRNDGFSPTRGSYGNRAAPGLKARCAGWAAVHFCTEVACFYWLYYRMGDSAWWWTIALLYDALAFVPQSFIGMLSDRFPRLRLGEVGVTMILAALLLPWNAVALPLLCIGNCMLHVEGARGTLCESQGKLAPVGIFVGGGSPGVILGRILGLAGCTVWVPIFAMLWAAGMILALPRPKDCEARGFDIAAPVGDLPLVLLTTLSVAARAYVAYAIPMGWNQEMWQSVWLFVTMGVGKALGGVLSDLIGARRTALWSLGLSIPLLCLGDRLMTVSLLGVALFSMTMPVSVGALVSRYPKNVGLCFGITTVGLFLGTAPAFFIRAESVPAYVLTIVSVGLGAIATFMITLRRKEK